MRAISFVLERTPDEPTPPSVRSATAALSGDVCIRLVDPFRLDEVTGLV